MCAHAYDARERSPERKTCVSTGLIRLSNTQALGAKESRAGKTPKLKQKAAAPRMLKMDPALHFVSRTRNALGAKPMVADGVAMEVTRLSNAHQSHEAPAEDDGFTV